ncbi:MAG: phosphoribosyl-AMP cyclohydrolase [Gammaproteobacteria bacterium]|nr:phosphoribosyl-AMP cyclohydrolase [Gammaproteobacteria bacterium]
MNYLDEIKWNVEGLVPVVTVDATSKQLLMLAWMNREALTATIKEGRAVYWSRSRGRLWRKGEESTHTQTIREIRLDCDSDAIQLLVEQSGGIACHTGRATCFYRRLVGSEWKEIDPVLKDPARLYASRQPE